MFVQNLQRQNAQISEARDPENERQGRGVNDRRLVDTPVNCRGWNSLGSDRLERFCSLAVSLGNICEDSG